MQGKVAQTAAQLQRQEQLKVVKDAELVLHITLGDPKAAQYHL